ncbi:Na+/H+ antiporter subunit G [Corynebacterium sp. HMSC06D04]|uniref:Na+/H+ antiporter subunit G n=1 Tax=Corynebacterium sp. HMSC06D04 TaxID=1581123 RepID=UPI0008A650C6|nr:Na+/H+ antiporter subunit G [Corynebacterium sp. HMSC06D04]OFT49960.1 Na+/H+ antiporter subunit G [Corynebacterium sp. HMSC06D04]
MAWYEIIASILLIVATLLVVATAIALWRAPDALTRVNLLGPTVGLAVPLLLVGKLVVDFAENGFDLWSLVRVLIACFGVWIIGSVGSFYMGRSIYGVTVTDVKYARRVRKQTDMVEASEDEV